MRSSLILFTLALLVAACIPDFVGENRSLPRGTDATVTVQSTYVSNTANELIFDTEISWLANQQFAFYDISNSLVFSGPATYTLLDSLEGVVTAGIGASSTIMLIDQSGTYDSIDGFNYRSDGVNKFCHDIRPPGNFMLGAFARQGKLTAEPVEYFQSDFSNDADGQSTYLFGLASRTGGSSSLYDAVNDAVDKIASANTGSNKKSIVVLAHGNDSGSTASPDSVIAKAVRAGIRIHVLLFSNNADPGQTAKLSESTGGIFNASHSCFELITALNLLYHMVAEPAVVSRIRIRYTPQSGTLQAGDETVHSLVIHDASAKYDFGPMTFYVKIPD